MSGGFFRGTSADQDTRFSNKQAKLLKTQKFAPELDHLVDVKKVKMDVMKPWIATRVTELLGFEDEVLINFIYGLLEGKDVNGKEVQISLTGFMEKHTAKFMKELWMLLLSAQKNASGVPQQFLDAKEEETRKKKLEADRIANEIQKKKEKESRELYPERLKNMDGADKMKATNVASDPDLNTMLEKDSSSYPMDEKEACERNDVRGRARVSRSPCSAARSPPSLRGSPSRSISKTHSNSRNYSDERHKSRSISRSPKARRRAISPSRRSITPRRRHSPRSSHSPSRRLSYSRRRSRSHSPCRSPSPLRRRLRSPFQCKSPLPLRRRSPSPARRQRSPSPARRRRSPSLARHRRSPSPIRRRRSPSPIRRRRSPSPVRRRRSPSPVRRRRSPSPVRRRRSPSPVRRRRSPSPVHRHRSSPIQRHRSPLHMRRASPPPLSCSSPSPTRRWSPSSMRRSSPSPVRRRYQRSPLMSPSSMAYSSPMPSRLRSPTLRSPPLYEPNSPSSARRRIHSSVRMKSSNDGRSPVHSAREKNDSLRSPQRDPKDMKDLHKREAAFSPSPERSPIVSESPPRLTRKSITSEDRRSFNPDGSPVRQTREQMVLDGSISPSPRPREWRPCQDGPEKSKENKETNHARADGDHKSVPLRGRSVRSSTVDKQRNSPVQVCNKGEHSPGSERLSRRSIHPETFEQQRTLLLYEDSLSGDRQRSAFLGESKLSEERNRSHKNNGQQQRSLLLYEDSLSGDRQRSAYLGESKLSEERNRSHKNNGKDSDGRGKSENATMEVENVDRNNRSDSFYSGSDESVKHKTKIKGKRKHKKHDSEEVASDDDLSEIDKKEAKRRKKGEKKLRREERRRRRDERRRRKEERRAAKLKMKNQNNADASDDEHVPRRVNHPSDDEESESAQKRLEIELRNKALESIKVKRNRSH